MSDSFDLPDNLSDRAEELLKHIPLQSWNAYIIPAIESLSKNENIGIACSGGADSTLCVLLMYAAFPDLKKQDDSLSFQSSAKRGFFRSR